MPELPDIIVYLEALERFAVGRRLERIRLASPFVLRTADPLLGDAFGKTLRAVRRLGKRIVFVLDGDLFVVVHLMIAGRFHWKVAAAKIPAKVGLAAFDFAHGTLMLTEASSKKRAAMHLVVGKEALAAFAPGGIEPLEMSAEALREVLGRENHTLKRALTDPGLFSGIGNAYSDEILHRARLSPLKLTRTLDGTELARLYQATRATLAEWIERLRDETGQGFPERVTAFREGMTVHGRYGQPCPVCGTPVQRIVHAENEANYCPTCQVGGKLLADRALSRLLGERRPKTVKDLKAKRRAQGGV